MKEHLIRFFRFSHWANLRVLDTLEQEGITDEKMIFWINHNVNAELIWLDRIQGRPFSTSPLKMRPLAAVREAMESSHQLVMTYLQDTSPEELAGSIAYQNSRGDAFENVIQDILAHVANHHTHHRSQIAARLREQGIAPPPTDYIFYLRD
ncbi:MAG: DinB family protein [Bacteroidota bacterium]